jgi:hypothetical protein
LLLSQIEINTYKREGELKIKLKKKEWQKTERKMEIFFIKKLERGRNSKKEGEEEWERGRT